MFVALLLNFTLLPALIYLTRPPGAPVRPPSARLTLIENFVLDHRTMVVTIGITGAAVSSVLLPFLHF